MAYIYSAEPLKLKKFGWIGNYALGASYIALPWWCGQSLFGDLNPEALPLLPTHPAIPTPSPTSLYLIIWHVGLWDIRVV